MESESSTPEFWTDQHGQIVTNPPGPAVHERPSVKLFGSCWLDADASGNPVEPQGAVGLPSQYPPIPQDPQNPGAIKIVWPDSLVVVSVQNAVLGETSDGVSTSRHFDLSNAVLRFFSPSRATLPFPDAAPAERPFQYPAGAWFGSPYRSVLADIRRGMPRPSLDGELVLPQVPAPPIIADRKLPRPVLNGQNCYKVGLTGVHDNNYPSTGGVPCIVPNQAGINSAFEKNIGFFDTGGGGRWVGQSIGIYADSTEFSVVATSSEDQRCVATVFDLSLYPAVEKQRGWEEAFGIDQSSVISTPGLPERLFPSERPEYRLPENGTALDLLIVLANYKWLRVDATYNEIDQDVTTDRGYDIHAKAKWYTLSQGTAENWNTFVWGQFRQIVPVAPRQLTSSQNSP